MEVKRTVYYVLDGKQLDVSRNIPNMDCRAHVVHSLISSYGLLSKCKVIRGEAATDEDLLSFHSSDYLNYLRQAQTSSNSELTSDAEDEDFNIGYDCPLFENIYDFVKIVAGGSLSAARRLVQGRRIEKSVSRDDCRRDVCDVQPKSYLKFRHKHLAETEMKKKKEDVYELPSNLSHDESLGFEPVGYKKVQRGSAYSRLHTKENVPKTTNNEEANTHAVAINWFGGWHHAQRDAAEGFCYVNDIVIAIQYLLRSYKRMLYVDLDVHHGNGVENAFLFSPRVFVLSFHKYESGFYPTSGSLEDIGEGNGKFFTANVPLKAGITDDAYFEVFESVTRKVLAKYKPESIVVQCGADTIVGDPLGGGFNLTPVGIGKCLKLILDEKLPTLVLGGGGYNPPNVARTWAYLTSLILNCPLSNDIPDNSYFHMFGPGFELSVTPSLRPNENTKQYLKSMVDRVITNLDALPDGT